MRIRVVHYSWTADGRTFAAGENELELDAPLAKLVAAAAAAGAVEVVETNGREDKLLAGHVQSDEDALAEQARAMADGRWHEGNLIHFANHGHGMAADAPAPAEPEAEETA